MSDEEVAVPIVSEELAESLQSVFLNIMPESTFISHVHKEGEIIIDEDTRILVPTVLFDTGALHGSYISQSFVNKHKAMLIPFLYSCNGMVRLADNKTIINITQLCIVPIAFIGLDVTEHFAEVTLYVFPTSGNDIIIGLPAIIASFSDLLKEMIDAAVTSKANMDNNNNNISILQNISYATEEKSMDSSKIFPWTFVDNEAPEDLETELPSSFSYALHFMEMSVAEALEEYRKLIPTHVSQEFRDATNIVKLLETKGSLVFVPQNWEGINGIPPLELKFKEGFPESLKPRARPVNPKLFEHAKKEFERLAKYFYTSSTSPVASCLVIAPKATAPFIRFCGDYVAINNYIEIPHFPIPHVQRSLEKIMKFKIFLDFDWVNSFHQIKLGEITSARLSVQTPWGQVQPRFLPEGVGPASSVLQSIVVAIFADFDDWIIAIFDNLLVLAYDYEDAYRKTEMILDRCIGRNVFLKFSKTWLGFKEANFFGYVVKEGKYELSQQRKDAIMSIPFPSNTKQMQSFLGAALFFKSFIPHYSSLTAPLNDMVKITFNWDEKTWKQDYRAIYEQFKQELQKATAIFYPDYELDWILRTDASLHGVGAVLLQVTKPIDNSAPQYQPICLSSQKFSDAATRWSTIEQEAYGIYFGVKSFSYYLMCKQFVLETDHNNLLWIEASAVPKVIRWRIYLQSFSFLLRHIPGKHNIVADWLSRAHASTTVEPESAEDAPTNACIAAIGCAYMYLSHLEQCLYNQEHGNDIDTLTPEQLYRLPPKTQFTEKVIEIFRQCHRDRNLHVGTRATWRLMNEHFPGHKIPYRVVSEMVANCPVCQKDRLGMAPFDTIEPIVRTLRPPHQRALIGADTLTITPPDRNGNSYLINIVVILTKLCFLYPSKQTDAITVATAIFLFCCYYGLFDSLITDPGSEFDNEVVRHLNSWFGINHRFSLVDRHESNGVEATNREIQRYLRALVMDERIKDRWSDPTVIGIIQFQLNSHINSETGVVPFHAHFGTHAGTYFKLPEEGTVMQRASAYIKLLAADLKLIKEISDKVQDEIAKERTAKVPLDKQNLFQQGDLVLWQLNPDQHRPTKLTPRFVGPYIVISHDKNEVKCKHVIMHDIKTFHTSRLKIFHGTLEEAKRVALIDQDQYTVVKILAYRGNPEIRTTMEFEVEFADGEIVWKVWDQDLAQTAPFEDYCRSRSELYPLIYSAVEYNKMKAAINRSPITEVQPGDVVFVDLRSYGATWYSQLPLADKEHTNYVVEYRYTKWANRSKTKITAMVPVFQETWKSLDHNFVKMYGTNKAYNSLQPTERYRLVDEELVRQYPQLLPSSCNNTNN